MYNLERDREGEGEMDNGSGTLSCSSAVYIYLKVLLGFWALTKQSLIVVDYSSCRLVWLVARSRPLFQFYGRLLVGYKDGGPHLWTPH